MKKPLQNQFKEITRGHFAAFIHNRQKIYQILRYINHNETGRKITFVHCKCAADCEDHKDFKGVKELERIIADLQAAGAFRHFKIDVIYCPTPFGPQAIDKVAKDLRINRNKILIGSIHDSHPYEYSDLGGVRVII